jgi:hypothetical protein
MLNEAVLHSVDISGQKYNVRVLNPHDIIGLKVQAMANDPSRKHREIADMESILEIHHQNIDWKKLRSYFELFNLTETFDQLRQRYAK